MKYKTITDLCEVFTNIVHHKHDEMYRSNFIKYYYVGLLFQYRYILNDYFKKHNYKIIQYNGEFGPELKYVVPFAYWHYCNGTLKKTISSKHTKEFYYFSDNHEEKYTERKWRPYCFGIPNSEDHNIKYNFKQWRRVPYKDIYRNDIFVYNKPILIIANKYNMEWGEKPVNYLNIDILKRIIENYSDKYQIVYNRAPSDYIINDNSKIIEYDDYNFIKRNYPSIICMQDLFKYVKSESIPNFNKFQLMMYANAKRFVSVHGGASVLASYFGGVNIIYSVKGFEHYFNEFESLYPKLSGAKIIHAKTNQALMKAINDYL